MVPARKPWLSLVALDHLARYLPKVRFPSARRGPAHRKPAVGRAAAARPWDGVRDATKFGNAAIQTAGTGEDLGGPQSEDCLLDAQPHGARQLPSGG